MLPYRQHCYKQCKSFEPVAIAVWDVDVPAAQRYERYGLGREDMSEAMQCTQTDKLYGTVTSSTASVHEFICQDGWESMAVEICVCDGRFWKILVSCWLLACQAILHMLQVTSDYEQVD